ncbi:MAG: MTAP family purine nucleoside phosphorylase, partial [Candidatus Odinarchaeia archaeon]
VKITHDIPPHKINYKANVYGLFKKGVRRIIATHSCGSLKKNISPGTFVLPNQFLDFTKQRDGSFFDGSKLISSELGYEKSVIHVDMSKPFCPDLVEIIYSVLKMKKFTAIKGGVYVCTEGPRFETPAEINMFKLLGGDVVGMTALPEAVLSRELGMCYASISLVSNYAAGITDKKLTFEEVIEVFENNKNKLLNVLQETIPKIDVNKDCTSHL